MQVESVRAIELPYVQFVRKYMGPNEPVLICDLTAGWGASTAWVTGPDRGVDMDGLVEGYGDSLVPVVSCGEGEEGDSRQGLGEYGLQPSESIPLREYGDRWRSGLVRGRRPQYLKDWHLADNDADERARVYTTPMHFQDDWLNWWCDRDPAQQSDYRFVYLGPKGSWTPLHHDVLRSFSWSANIVGKKRWILFPPSVAHELRGPGGSGLVPDARPSSSNPATFARPCQAGCDGASLARAWNQRVEVMQGTGDALFVPSGWHHQVHNVEDTLSINHNWFNAYNLHHLIDFLKTSLEEVRRSLEDLRPLVPSSPPTSRPKQRSSMAMMDSTPRMDLISWTDQCDVLLKANVGMGVDELIRMLCARARFLLHWLDEHGDGQREDGEGHEGVFLALTRVQNALRDDELIGFWRDGGASDGGGGSGEGGHGGNGVSPGQASSGLQEVADVLESLGAVLEPKGKKGLHCHSSSCSSRIGDAAH